MASSVDPQPAKQATTCGKTVVVAQADPAYFSVMAPRVSYAVYPATANADEVVPHVAIAAFGVFNEDVVAQAVPFHISVSVVYSPPNNNESVALPALPHEALVMLTLLVVVYV